MRGRRPRPLDERGLFAFSAVSVADFITINSACTAEQIRRSEAVFGVYEWVARRSWRLLALAPSAQRRNPPRSVVGFELASRTLDGRRSTTSDVGAEVSSTRGNDPVVAASAVVLWNLMCRGLACHFRGVR